MKKLSTIGIFLLVLSPLACNRPVTPASPSAPSAPTSTLTPNPDTPTFTPASSPSTFLSPSATPTDSPTPLTPVSTATATPTLSLPAPTSTPTPTPTGTFICGFTPVTIQMPPNYGTPGPGTPTLTPFPTIAPPTGPVSPLPITTPTPYVFTPAPLIVIRSQADWQAFYGAATAPPAPVDFTTSMLIVYKRTYCTCNNMGVLQVCVDSSQVTVTFGNIGPYCWVACYQPTTWGFAGVAVPQTSLPVTWAPSYSY